jgi:hypothetical protein
MRAMTVVWVQGGLLWETRVPLKADLAVKKQLYFSNKKGQHRIIPNYLN